MSQTHDNNDANSDEMAASADKTVSDIFTAREQEIMLNVVLSLKEAMPTPDYTELAARLGMSNIRSASNAWAALRKKIQERNTDGAVPALAKRKTPAKQAKATPSKRKKAGGAPSTPNDEDDDELIDPASTIKNEPKNTDDGDDVQVLPASKRAKGTKGGRVVPPPAGLANPQGDVGDMTLVAAAQSADEAPETPTHKPAAATKKAPAKPRAPRVKKDKAAAAADGGEANAAPKAAPKRRGRPPKSDAKIKQEDLDDDVPEEAQEKAQEEAGDNSGAEILAIAAAALQVVEENAAASEDGMEVDAAEVKAEGGDEAGVV